MKPNIKIVGLGTAGVNILNVARPILDSMNLKNVEFFSHEGGLAKLDDVKLGESPYYSREKILSNGGKGDAPTLLLLVGGLGGSFASLEIPALAMFAKKRGYDVGAFVSWPFRFEGNKRSECSTEAKNVIKETADFYAVFNSKDTLKMLDGMKATMQQAFEMQDQRIADALVSFVQMIVSEGTIAVDYADVRTLWRKGPCHLKYAKINGVEGESGADAVARCKNDLEYDLKGATAALIMVSHGREYTLEDYSESVSSLYDMIDGNPDIIVADRVEESSVARVTLKIFFCN